MNWWAIKGITEQGVASIVAWMEVLGLTAFAAALFSLIVWVNL